jgi:hypothetical protein
MKVTALTPIKHGTKDGIEEIAIGQSFEVEKKHGDKLIADGSAVAGSSKAGGKNLPPPVTRESLDAALAALPGENDDPEYVVRAMRNHFGELFTAADETKVREAVVKA